MNIVIFMSLCPRPDLIEAMFVRWAFPHSGLHRTNIRSVQLGWVYLFRTFEDRSVVASVMCDLPVQYMGPWEYIPVS